MLIVCIGDLLAVRVQRLAEKAGENGETRLVEDSGHAAADVDALYNLLSTDSKLDSRAVWTA